MKRTSYHIIVLIFACVFSINAQQKLQKISKSIDVDNEVTIDLNTSFTDIEIDTWNSNVLQVEAYIESDKLSKDDLKKALKEWDISVAGYGDNVSIKTKGTSSSWAWASDLGELGTLIGHETLNGLSLAFEDMPAFPELPELPEMPELPEVPEFPSNFEIPEFPDLPRLPEGITNINFDTKEYKERGEDYLDEWSDKLAKRDEDIDKEALKDWGRKFADSDFEGKMEAWGEAFGEKFGKKMEVWGEKFGESWGEEFGKNMEAWGEEFGEKYASKMERWGESLDEKLKEKYGEDYERELEKRAERFAKRAEERAHLIEERYNNRPELFDDRSNSKIKKTLKIKMPKDAKLKVNVRHGELKVSAIINNLKADLTHSALVANSIDGSSTSIDASYSDVNVNNWIKGDLKLNYVENAILDNVRRLVLTSNSSDISIGKVFNSALIDGSFGDLVIENIDDDFNSLNIILENSDANISLPRSNYELLFKGNRSKLNDERTDKKVIKNYPEGANSDKTIVVNAKYSNVVMQ